MCGLKKNCDIYSAQNLFEGAKSKDFLEIFEVGIQDHDYLYHTDMGGGGSIIGQHLICPPSLSTDV